MPEAKKVNEAAQMVANPLKEIGTAKYMSPWDEPSRETTAGKQHISDFETLQKTAKATATTLGKGADTIIKDHKIIQVNIDTIKKRYDDYEKPFKAQGNTSKIAKLSKEVNAAVRSWQEVVSELKR